MRTLLLSAALGLVTVSAAGTTAAQTFRLVDPALTVDGRRVGVVGGPLVQEPFGALTLAVPGSGLYRVSDRPFDGARAVGQFDGDGLFFAVDGRSVRLRSAEPILDGAGPATAFVRFDASGAPTGRGLARVAVADAPDGRGRSSDLAGIRTTVRTERPRRGPDPAARADAARADDARADDARAEADRLRARLDRVEAEGRALAAERDRLRAERDAPRRGATGSQTRWTAGREAAYGQALSRSAGLAAERDRLLSERDQIATARDRAEAERVRLAADLDAARRRAETAEARGTTADARRADEETSRLRAAVVARDESIAALRVESDDRRIRLAETDAALARAQRDLRTVTAERDAAVAARDAARAERDVALAARGSDGPRVARLEAERDQLASERDRAFRDRDALLGGRAAIDADRAALDADRARFETDRSVGTASLTAEQQSLLADRQRLLDRLAAAQADRDALALQVSVLQQERDGLAADLAAERAARLRSGASGTDPLRLDAGRPDAPPMPDAPRDVVRTPQRDGAVAYFPGFDFGRLRNPDVVRRRLDEAEYPEWAAAGRITGDVLVLFQTDASGRVIRTAVASPIGGGLDGLAESLVRDMQFVPPTVDGVPTGLRSQVLVRFEM